MDRSETSEKTTKVIRNIEIDFKETTNIIKDYKSE